MKSRFSNLLFAALVPCTSAVAAVPPAQLPSFEVIAAPIVGDTTVDRFGRQTTSIGPEQLAALNAADLASALRRTPGVTITRYNAVGAFGGGEGGAVLLRGLGSSRPGGEVRTLLDGVPVANGVFNHPLLDLLPVELVGGIEVMRRAEPLTAGNMFAGVSLTAPRVTQPGGFVQLSGSAGSFGARSETFTAGGRFGTGDFFLGQNYRTADGHRPGADGTMRNVLVRAAWSPVAALELSYLAHRSDNRAGDPGPEAGAGLPPTRGDVYLTDAWLHAATAAWTRAAGGGSLKAYLNSGDGNWLRRTTSANADSLNNYRVRGLRWTETQRPWEGGELTGGADVEWTRGTSLSVPPAGRTLVFGPETFRLASAYGGANHTWKIGNGGTMTPSAGARAYRHDRFGEATSPQAGLVWRQGAWQAHASVGRAVRFPGLEVAAFSTVAIPALGQSWRTLKPERLTQSEIGLAYEAAKTWRAEVTLFRNAGRDRYVFVPPPPPPFRFLNVERFETEGAEFTLTARPMATVSVFAGVGLLRTTPGDLPYAPKRTLTGGLTWRIRDGLTFNADASYTGEQYAGAQARANGAPNTERVGAFALLNLRLAYALPVAWAVRKTEVFVAGDNVLDRDYRYRPGYPMPGAGFTAGATIRF